jgi:hypothetical protein
LLYAAKTTAVKLSPRPIKKLPTKERKKKK